MIDRDKPCQRATCGASYSSSPAVIVNSKPVKQKLFTFNLIYRV
jgi:hypothetical protein